jgi:hypothetical protein
MDINRVSEFEKCPETNTRLVYDFWKDYIYQGTRLVYQNGDVSPTITLPNQQHYQTNNTPINSTRKIRETPSLHDTTFHGCMEILSL